MRLKVHGFDIRKAHLTTHAPKEFLRMPYAAGTAKNFKPPSAKAVEELPVDPN